MNYAFKSCPGHFLETPCDLIAGELFCYIARGVSVHMSTGEFSEKRELVETTGRKLDKIFMGMAFIDQNIFE